MTKTFHPIGRNPTRVKLKGAPTLEVNESDWQWDCQYYQCTVLLGPTVRISHVWLLIHLQCTFGRNIVLRNFYGSGLKQKQNTSLFTNHTQIRTIFVHGICSKDSRDGTITSSMCLVSFWTGLKRQLRGERVNTGNIRKYCLGTV